MYISTWGCANLVSDICSPCLSPRHGYADKLHGTLEIHPPTMSSHHWSWQSRWKCAPSPSHVFSGQLSSYHSVKILAHGKLAKPTRGPYQLIDVACQHVNGAVMVDLNHSHEIFNIWWLIHLNLAKTIEDVIWSYHMPHHIIFLLVANYDSHIRVITMLADPLRKSIHFLHQYTSPFATLPSVLFYKEGLYISMQHRTEPWHGSLFTGSPHHHLVRVEIITSFLVPIVSILLYNFYKPL
jgi:hypothetical protein